MKKFILFDFDGVIADSFAAAFEVNRLTCPGITEEDYRKRMEGNINDNKFADIQHDERCRHDIDFFTEYIPRMKNQVVVFPGMAEVIDELAKSYTLIVISSTITEPIRELLEKYHLAHYFTEIMGNDVHTSKIEKIKMVFSKYDTDSKNCLFITDSLGDVKEATHCEVDVIGVTWGFNKLETLKKGKSYKIAGKPEELVGAVEEYFEK